MHSDLTPNYLNKLVEERDLNMVKFQDLAGRYAATGAGSLMRRLQERAARIKVLNNRIARHGEKYSIVKVTGKYICNTGNLSIDKSFVIYYTEISEYDATCKANMHYKGQAHSIKTEPIPTGKDLSDHWFK